MTKTKICVTRVIDRLTGVRTAGVFEFTGPWVNAKIGRCIRELPADVTDAGMRNAYREEVAKRKQQAAEEKRYAELCAEYETWNKANGLSLGSAGDHLFDDKLTSEQREWLVYFVARWDAVEARS